MVELISTMTIEDTSCIEHKFWASSINCNRDRLLGNCSLKAFLIICSHLFITSYCCSMIFIFFLVAGIINSFVRVFIFSASQSTSSCSDREINFPVLILVIASTVATAENAQQLPVSKGSSVEGLLIPDHASEGSDKTHTIRSIKPTSLSMINNNRRHHVWFGYVC